MRRSTVLFAVVLVATCGVPATAQVSIDTLVLTAPDGHPGDAFGRSVAISGDTLIVGAPGDDERGENAGAAYVFVRDASGTWRLQQQLLAAELLAGDTFGWSVAVDGDLAVVGAPRDRRGTAGLPDPAFAGRGAAYVFQRFGVTWQAVSRMQPDYLLPGDGYGWAVACSGETVMIAAPFRDAPPEVEHAGGGLVSVHRRTPSGWSAEASLTGGYSPSFGRALALQGDDAVIGSGAGFGALRCANGTWLSWPQTDEWADGEGDAALFVDRPLAYSGHLARDLDGTLLVLDVGLDRGRIRRVAPTGEVRTWREVRGFSGITADATGRVWTYSSYCTGTRLCGRIDTELFRYERDGTEAMVASESGLNLRALTSDGQAGVFAAVNCSVRRYHAAGGYSTVVGDDADCRVVDGQEDARLAGPYSLALATGNLLYIADGGRLRRLDLETHRLETVTDVSTGGRSFWAIAAHGASLWLVEYGPGMTVRRFDGDRIGPVLAGREGTWWSSRPLDGKGAAAYLNQGSVTVTADGRLAVFSDGLVRLVSSNGDVTTLAGWEARWWGDVNHGGLGGYAVALRSGQALGGAPLASLFLSPEERVGSGEVRRRGTTSSSLSPVIPYEGEALDRYGAAVAFVGERAVALGPANGCLWRTLDVCIDEAAGYPEGARVVPIRLFRQFEGGRWRQRSALPVPNLPASSGYGSVLASDGHWLAAGAPEWDYRPQEGPPYGDIVGPGRVFVYDLATFDSDGDGMPDDWEDRFGLDPTDPDDAAGDLDGDGVTNAQEFAARTHPNNDHAYTRHFAEGATSDFFETEVSLANPGPTTVLLDPAPPAIVNLRFMKATGELASTVVSVPPQQSRKVRVSEVTGMAHAEFSTQIESDQQVVADRLMTWSREQRYGSHGERAMEAPAATWYLAEGATHSGFDLFYLILNPGAAAIDVRVSYLRPSGAPLTKTYAVGPNSRFNIWVNLEEFGEQGRLLANTDVSAVIEALDGAAILVERAMYRTRPGADPGVPGTTFEAGHASAGITTPATTWFFAEGATGDFFDEFLLLANPSTSPADVTVTYLLPDGTTYSRDVRVGAESRFNIWVDQETSDGIPGLPLENADAVSATLEVTNGVPIVAERAMWWPGPTAATWTEAHASAGATTTAGRWVIAAGKVSNAPSTDTYYLIANPDSWRNASVAVTLLFDDGTPAVTRWFTVPPHSRLNVDVRTAFPEAVGKGFAADLRAPVYHIIPGLPSIPSAPFVVEWAIYSDALGQRWAAGANALATPVP